MSVIVRTPPYTNFQKDFIEGETISQLVQRIKDDDHLQFRGVTSVIDIHDGHLCSDDEIVVDGRRYHLNVWIAQ